MKKGKDHEDEGYYFFTKDFFFMPVLVWVKAFCSGDHKDYCHSNTIEKENYEDFLKRATKIVEESITDQKKIKKVRIIRTNCNTKSWALHYMNHKKG